ncbi:MAG: pentapeptide repeat-containing protein [Akkermansiaceae bacterium]|nr:pentapeptide repeat-containing protein [Akkermansiaceae bacterium]
MENPPPASGSVFAGENFQKVNWSGKELDRVEFSGCGFRQCGFERTVFRDCLFEDCEFEACDLTLAEVTGSSFNPAVFRNCKASGIVWYRVGFAFDAAFLDCQLDYSSFFGMKLNRVRFTGSRLKEVTFVDAVAKDVHFKGCDLEGAVFTHTDLSRADFTGAMRYDINVTQNQVKGAIFDLPEAVRLLSYFGIKLK